MSKLLVAHASSGPGIVECLAFNNGDAEANGIAALVRKLLDAGVGVGDILVLLRSDYHGAFSTPIKAALDALRIPSIVRTPEKSALDARQGRLLLALLRLQLSPDDDLAWRSAFETGNLGIGETTIAGLHELATDGGISLAQALSTVEADASLLPGRRAPLVAAVATLRARLANASRTAPRDIATVAETIAAIAAQLPASPELEAAVADLNGLVLLWAPSSLDDFLSGLALRKEEEEDLVRNTVNIMTAHKAKGLDACVVIVAAAEEELFPGRGQVDEERRLFYVSLTRARHALFITWARNRSGQQARAGIPSWRHHRTQYLEGVGLGSKIGAAYLRDERLDPGLLGPQPVPTTD